MITNTDIYYINMLCEVASNLKHKYIRCKHAAALVEKRKLLSIGVNKEKTDPFQTKYTRHENLSFVHAEIDCLKNVEFNPKKSTLYVVRSNKKDEYLESCPCEGCMAMIKDKNIKRIVYTTNDGIKEIIR